MTEIAAKVLVTGYTIALALIMMGRADLVWKGISYSQYFMLKEINKPWADPSIFHHVPTKPAK